jgi:hypothetical protein
MQFDWTIIAKLALQYLPLFLPSSANANPIISSSLAAAAAYDHDTIKWLQGSLNKLFNANLLVDGIWGNNTKKAVQNAASRLGLPATSTLSHLLIIAVDAALKEFPKT